MLSPQHLSPTFVFNTKLEDYSRQYQNSHYGKIKLGHTKKKSDTQFAKSPNYSGHHISYKAQSHVQFGGNSNATNKFKPEPPHFSIYLCGSQFNNS